MKEDRTGQLAAGSERQEKTDPLFSHCSSRGNPPMGLLLIFAKRRDAQLPSFPAHSCPLVLRRWRRWIGLGRTFGG